MCKYINLVQQYISNRKPGIFTFHYLYTTGTIHCATTLQVNEFYSSVRYNKYRKDSTLGFGYIYVVNTFI
jgi:hypothetical protein